MTPSKQVTVRKAVEMIGADDLLLPSIQRSFVWAPKQIGRLFDSMMRGYPIGTLLLWRTVPNQHKELRFHRFHTAYDGTKDHGVAFKPQASKSVLAALDGQQRLTALNIGLRGSLKGSPTAPPRWLYIDLDVDVADAGSEGNRYAFDFRTGNIDNGNAWFEVSQAVGVRPEPAALKRAMTQQGIEPTLARRMVLKRLVEVVNSEPLVHFEFVPTNKSLDEVLNIFARCNMGGTKLSYVDLLVSTASAKMQRLNPATEFHRLRQDLEQIGLSITIDRIVKTSLVLIGLEEPKFHVESLLRASNMKKLEAQWSDIADAMRTAAKLLTSFGLDDRTLVAENALIPVASYAFLNRLSDTYVTGDRWEKDRDRVKAFVARTVLRRGYWTGAVDSVLVTAHSTIRKHSGKTFPLEALTRALKSPKAINVDEAWVDELATLDYGDRRTRTLLTLLYPRATEVGKVDKDHVFPVSVFNDARMAAAGIPKSVWDDIRQRADTLPNLQLLGESDNRTGKKAKMPQEWLKPLGQSAKKRYSLQHVNLKVLPADLSKVDDFWTRRHARLRTDITALLRGPAQ